jgi:hypothetical protein
MIDIAFSGSIAIEEEHHGLAEMTKVDWELFIEDAIEEYVKLKHPDCPGVLVLVHIGDEE